jgi:serine/threonine protein phosphatase PrpC
MNHVARLSPPPPLGLLAWVKGYPATRFSVRSSSPANGDLPNLADDDDNLDDLAVLAGEARIRELFIERGAEVEAPAGWTLSAGSVTDIGRARRDNQDAILAMQEDGVFVVADGMGGHSGGAIASRLAVEAIRIHAIETRQGKVTPLPSIPLGGARLVHGFVAANRSIRQAALRSPNLAEMGSTLVGMRFAPETGRLYVAHVGDSRCYRLRAFALEQLTRDHTVATLGSKGRFVHRLSRAIGPSGVVDVDLSVLTPRDGDTYLLCSDGLTRMLSKEQIQSVLEIVCDPTGCAAELVARANQAGGTDNVSAIVVRVSRLV